MPSKTAIKGEMVKMDDTNYDHGLIRGLYYLTKGEPRLLVQDYIDWCRAPEATKRLHDRGMYGAADL